MLVMQYEDECKIAFNKKTFALTLVLPTMIDLIDKTMNESD